MQRLERLDRAGHPREAMRDEVVEHDLALRDRLRLGVLGLGLGLGLGLEVGARV